MEDPGFMGDPGFDTAGKAVLIRHGYFLQGPQSGRGATLAYK